VLGLAAQRDTRLQWLPHCGFGNSLDVPRYSLLIPPAFFDYSKNLNMFLCHGFHLFPWHFLEKYFFIFS
jgi:hypothetical protein